MDTPATVAKMSGQPESGRSTAADKQQSSCLMLALNGPDMIVPRAVIADVLKYSFVEFTHDEEAGLDFFDWRGCRVPVSGSRVVGDLMEVNVNDETRIVILYGLTDTQNLPFYGVIAGKGPQLLQLGDQDVKEISSDNLQAAELMRVVAKGTTAFIPRVDHFERSILKLLQRAEH